MRRKIFAYLVCLCMIAAIAVLPSFAAEDGEALLSPGLDVIAARCGMVVSGVPGGEVVFTREDFARAVGYVPESIRITARPDLAVGQLTIGSVVVPEGQVLCFFATSSKLSFPSLISARSRSATSSSATKMCEAFTASPLCSSAVCSS